MGFDTSKVFGMQNADEVKVGSVAYFADNMADLIDNVVHENSARKGVVTEIKDYHDTLRFNKDDFCNFGLVYVIKGPEKKALKWTELTLGDAVKNTDDVICMITGLDPDPEDFRHVYFNGKWYTDEELVEWEKVRK